ncbi:MAG TPA: ABC transporter permease, partial [Bryobacteraceae bacterium]
MTGILLSILRFPASMLMLVYQSIILALAQVRTNKVRSMLTTIGIVIGVASVTAVIAALTGLKTKLLSDVESFGANKIYLYPNIPDDAVRRHARLEDFEFTPEQFEGLLQHCPSVERFTRIAGVSKIVSNGPRSEANANVQGIDPDFLTIENRSIVLGRPFTLIDETQARPVCIISAISREKLGLNVDCIGQSIMIGTRRFVVVGVIEPRNEGMFSSGQSESEYFIPFKTASEMQRSNMTVICASRSPEVSDEAQAELIFFLRKRRHIAPGEPDTFIVQVLQKFIDKFKSIAETTTVVAAGVVGISLLVGGVGIMNIMLVSVSERTREIGLRKAVGARPSAILLQFLVEAIILCCLGGAVGVGLGEIFTRLLKLIPHAHLDKAYIPG